MAKRDYVFASESVSEGHPDKVCDRISDAVVDTFLAADPQSRCGVETLATTNRVVLAGEVRGPGDIGRDRLIEVARQAIREIGYEQEGFHWNMADIACYVHEQSADIAQGVDAAGNKDEGAGDQGIMFGYACRETPELMPAPIFYAHAILKALSDDRHAGKAPLLGPDAKSQISLRYVDGKPVGATSVVVSTQHSAKIEQQEVREVIRPYVLKILPEGWMCDEAPHGGGAFSGKDPTKVDRSAAYAARYLAKNVVGAGIAERCTIQLSYAIGVSKPLSVYVDTSGTGQVDEDKLSATLQEMLDLSPRGIRTHLGLNKPIYARTSAYGHFGRKPEADGGFSWERLDLVDALKRAF